MMEGINSIRKDTRNDEISFEELLGKLLAWFKYLLSKWMMILISGIAGAAMGLLYSYFYKPIYKAQLSFALEDEKTSGGLGGALGLASQFGFDLGGAGGGAFSGDNLLELMKSRSMVQKALLTDVNVNGQKQTLAELYISFNGLRSRWSDKPSLRKMSFVSGIPFSSFSLQQDSLLGVFYNDIIKNNLLVAKTDKKLTIIKVVVNSRNELFSKYFAEILAKTVSDFYVETKTLRSVKNVNILQHQTDSVRRELNSAITGVAYSVDAIPNANPSRQVLRVTSSHRQIDVQANQAILTELVKNLEISKVTLRRETPLIQVIDFPILPLEKESVGKFKGACIGILIMIFITSFVLVLKQVFQDIKFVAHATR